MKEEGKKINKSLVYRKKGDQQKNKKKEQGAVLDKKYIISCILCEKWMSMSGFDEHYY